jgi:hypothetical protein
LIPSLLSREGLKTWTPQPSSWSDPQVPAKSWKKWEDYCNSYKEDGKPQMRSKQQAKDKLSESMFPPTNINSLHIDRWLALFSAQFVRLI